MTAVPAGFWWIGRPNFGDLLTPLLVAHFSNTDVAWAPAREAEFVAVGSVLEFLPPRWPGIVAGAGKLHESSEIDFSRATVLALRGPLSAKNVKGRPVLGDPGLLANELVEVNKEYNLGVVPHWSDTMLETRFQEFHPRIIRPSDDPIHVIREIGRCKKIVSSSLHGIVVADAFGIPRRTEMTKIFSKEGGDFKFRDYNAAVGVPFQVGITQEAPRHIIENVQQELFDVFHVLGETLWGRVK